MKTDSIIKIKNGSKNTVWALICGGSSLLAFGQEATPEKKPLELSPFVVNSSTDVGYMATSTLAGTRIKTDLKDLGSSISVVTSEFMKDIGATDAGTLLSYTANTEVGGYQGNFSGGDTNSQGRVLQVDARTNPQKNQRIRGLGPADMTRGFFLTDIGFDSYNTDRVTVSRGPNSLLFGIGSPGGVVDATPKQAMLGRNSREVSVKGDNFGTLRTTFDLNQMVMKNRAALRIAGLYNDQQFKQKQAFDLDQRLYVALNVILAKNAKSGVLGQTVFRANGEAGKSGGAPPEIIPPSVAYHGWFEPVSPDSAQYTGTAPNRRFVSPANGGTWEFQKIHDNPLATGGDASKINTAVIASTFRHVGLTYANRGGDAIIGIPGSNLQGINSLIPWATNRDTLTSTGLAGTPVAQGLPGTTRVGTFQDFHTNSPYADSSMLGFTVPTLQNTDVFDYRNNLYSNGIERVSRKFSVVSLALEQSFLKDNLSLEVAYDRQQYDTHQNFVFSGGGGGSAGPYDIYIAMSKYLTNGQLNPNLGRAYTWVRNPAQQFRKNDRETLRATAFANVDFTKRNGWMKWLGRHRFTGMYSDYTLDTRFRETWDQSNSKEFDMTLAQEMLLGEGRRSINISAYTSASLLGVKSMDDIRLHPIDFKMYVPGDRFRFGYVSTTAANSRYAAGGIAGDRKINEGTIYVERVLNNDDISRTNIKSKVFSWQSYLLDDHLVGLFGYRVDESTNYVRANEAERGIPSRLVSDQTWNPTFTRLAAAPALAESGTTKSGSLIARYPEKWLGTLPWGVDLQAHYAQSESFNPIGLRNDPLGKSIGQPTGQTKEFGVLAGFAKNRYSIKLNWFETALVDVNAGVSIDLASTILGRINRYRSGELSGVPWGSGILRWVNGAQGSFPIQSHAAFYAATLGTMPQTLYDVVKPRQVDLNGDGNWDQYESNPIPNVQSTQDRFAKGFELELVANPTPAWRLMLNVSQQKTIQTNTATLLAALMEQYIAKSEAARLDELESDGRLEYDAEPYRIDLRRSLARVRTAKALDNTVSNEQREWRITGVSAYKFDRGSLKGFTVGGAVRWESKAATGYVFKVEPSSGVPIPDVRRPHFDDGVYSGDGWIGYESRILKGKYPWSVQLNVRNLVGESDDIPVKTNPDGQVAVIRIPNPRTISLTTTFGF